MAPLIYETTTDEITFNNVVSAWLDQIPINTEDSGSQTYSNLYAITLTITPNDKAKIVECGGNVIAYFKYILSTLKYNDSIFICEYTKKKCEHLHGFVYLPRLYVKENLTHKQLRIKGKFQHTFTDRYIPYQHVIKQIITKLQGTCWRKYMAKNCIHKNVLEYLQTVGDANKPNW